VTLFGLKEPYSSLDKVYILRVWEVIAMTEQTRFDRPDQHPSDFGLPEKPEQF
jgi:hypothetical protein